MPSVGILIAIALFVLGSFFYSTFKFVVALDPAIVLSAQGTCRITASQVHQWTASAGRGQNQRYAAYKAQVLYTLVTTDRRTFQGSSYDWLDDVITHEALDEAQARVDHYQVGHTYACWYNPLFPSMSALRQSVDWGVDRIDINYNTLVFNIGFLVGVLVLLVGLPIATVMTVTRSWSWSQRKAAP